MSRQVEIRVEGDEGLAIPRVDGDGTPRSWRGICVRYRFEPTRRWTKFLVEISPGQTLADALRVAIAVVGLDTGDAGGIRNNVELARDEDLEAVRGAIRHAHHKQLEAFA